MNSYPSRQTGVVLIVSLLFLLLVTLVATTASRNSTFQLQMAGNDQSRIEAQQQALAVIDAIVEDPASVPVVGDIGYKTCKTGSTDTSCDIKVIALPTSITQTASGTTLDYFVDRVGPLEAGAPTMSEDEASSASFYKVARFEANGSYNGSSARLGNASIVQGVLVRVSNPGN